MICNSWATTADLCGVCADYALDTGLLEDFLLSASETLYMLSGQQFPGTCSITIRPCSSRAPVDLRMVNISGLIADSSWGTCSCTDFDSCSCPSLSEIRLPYSPVQEVTQVKIDGAVVSPTLYRLDPPNLLVSLGDPWPCCQSLRLADSQPDTFSVSYTYGREVPALGVRAAARLACEFYMACDPEAFEGQCALPSNVITIARQGVTISKFVGELFVPQPGRPIRFGIPEIDLFLATYNPRGMIAPSVILSYDDPDVGRVTG